LSISGLEQFEAIRLPGRFVVWLPQPFATIKRTHTSSKKWISDAEEGCCYSIEE